VARQQPEADCYVKFAPGLADDREGYDGYVVPAQYTGRMSGARMLVILWTLYRGQTHSWQQWVDIDTILTDKEVEALSG